MKQSVQFSDSIHIMTYLATFHEPNLLKSSAIAQSVNTNPSNVRKIMGQLRRAGLVNSQQGKIAPHLAKVPEDISLLDIFKSLNGEKPILMVDKNTNVSCPVGANIQGVLSNYYDYFQEVIEQEMAQISLADVIKDMMKNIQTA